MNPKDTIAILACIASALFSGCATTAATETLPIGTIIAWTPSYESLDHLKAELTTGGQWWLCDGSKPPGSIHSTPNLTGRFLRGAGDYAHANEFKNDPSGLLVGESTPQPLYRVAVSQGNNTPDGVDKGQSGVKVRHAVDVPLPPHYTVVYIIKYK